MIGDLKSVPRTALGSDAVMLLRIVAVATLFGAQAIHVRAMSDHARVWPAAAAFFLVVAIAEGACGVWLVLAPGHRAARVAIALSFATMAVWAMSRIVGMPIGPHPWIAEPFAVPDVISTGLEMTTAICLVAWMRRSEREAPLSRAGIAAAAFSLIVVASVTWVGLAAPGHLDLVR